VNGVDRETARLIGSFAEEMCLKRHEKNPQIRTALAPAGEA
jgi:hypothetical protein